METYSLLRQFADSWMLLALFVFFAGVILWVFRPGAKKTYDDTADIPFRHEDKPAEDKEARK
ncbi:cbb3-type cytochrome c oxidase subunit 3 [Primorskyibacter flagellatus]|uniref:Cytochrome c oxidase cbb3-type subunit 4 n=1 Tax=Primorskyibacter flagellatus TaxID=1387277 RepID=A0A1W1ZP03_9RHOB|nr:cbb3-type cytochrome c oxidase subunit 3 [Primorskyibacter flagellatus]SMC50114.1 cytochrome c oxidase cbb3-type subunit 4 [Primorskyibacter flagellatus]